MPYRIVTEQNAFALVIHCSLQRKAFCPGRNSVYNSLLVSIRTYVSGNVFFKPRTNSRVQKRSIQYSVMRQATSRSEKAGITVPIESEERMEYSSASNNFFNVHWM